MTGGIDKQVLLWDLKMLSTSSNSRPMRTLSIDSTPVSKIALGPSNPSGVYGSILTAQGLYFINFATAQYSLITHESDPSLSSKTQLSSSSSPSSSPLYVDLKWNNAKNVLYVAGEDMKINVFSLLLR